MAKKFDLIEYSGERSWFGLPRGVLWVGGFALGLVAINEVKKYQNRLDLPTGDYLKPPETDPAEFVWNGRYVIGISDYYPYRLYSQPQDYIAAAIISVNKGKSKTLGWSSKMTIKSSLGYNYRKIMIYPYNKVFWVNTDLIQEQSIPTVWVGTTDYDEKPY
jgi:hypothetical protein